MFPLGLSRLHNRLFVIVWCTFNSNHVLAPEWNPKKYYFFLLLAVQYEREPSEYAMHCEHLFIIIAFCFFYLFK